MSRENVEAFYNRIAIDEAFRAQIQGVKSKDECSQIVKSYGYDFTQEEWEDYTIELLESDANDRELLKDLDEQELAGVIGGFSSQWSGRVQPLYGIVIGPVDPIDPPIKHRPYPGIQPLYGIVVPPELY